MESLGGFGAGNVSISCKAFFCGSVVHNISPINNKIEKEDFRVDYFLSPGWKAKYLYLKAKQRWKALLIMEKANI